MKKTLLCRAGITLIELLLATSLLGVLVLYFSALEQIGRGNLSTMERTIKVQNEAAYVLEYMAKQLRSVIGGPAINIDGAPANPFYMKQSGNKLYLKFLYDQNNNGQWDTLSTPPQPAGPGPDNFGCFRYKENRDDLEYRVYTRNNENSYNNNCNGNYNTVDLLSPNVTALTYTFVPNQDTPFSITKNYIRITLTVCYDTSTAVMEATCGTEANPQATMSTTVNMPMVSMN
jgi:type II secretory pathway component PulJ